MKRLFAICGLLVASAGWLKADALFYEDFSRAAVGDTGDSLKNWFHFAGWTEAEVIDSNGKQALQLNKEIVIKRKFFLDEGLVVTADLKFPAEGRGLGGIKIIPSESNKELSYQLVLDIRGDELSAAIVRVNGEVRQALSRLGDLRPVVGAQNLKFFASLEGDFVKLKAEVNGVPMPETTDPEPVAPDDVTISIFTFENTRIEVQKVSVDRLEP